MTDQDRILNFIGIGAQKAGTTSLHSVFLNHPEIYVPVVEKEPHYFDDDAKYSNGFGDYIQEYFAELTVERAVGEITPSLLAVPEARDRIAVTLGRDVKILVMLRHPVRRALSQYKMNLSWLREVESFEQAVSIEKVRDGSRMRFNYFGRGKYLDQLRHYLEVFERAQFHFILFEELVEDHQRVLSRCFEFLGVSDLTVKEFPHTNSQKNTQLVRFDLPTALKVNQIGREQEVMMPAGSWLINSDFKGRIRLVKSPKPLINDRLERIRGLLQQELPDRSRIQELYATHFERQEAELSDLTGLDLTKWH